MKYIYIFLLLLFLVACSITSNPSILSMSSCELPCWNDVIPAKTTFQESLAIIENLEFVDKESVVEINNPGSLFDKKIWFTLSGKTKIRLHQINGKVYLVNDKVAVFSLTQNLNVTLGEIIDKTGEPEFIISLPSHDGSTVIMGINPSNGVMFEIYPKEVGLQPETNIDTLVLFDKNLYINLLDANIFSMGWYGREDTEKIMYPWKGYGNMEELYPPRLP